MIISLAGTPYHIQPAVLLREWTLPQALFAYIHQMEENAADARQQFLLTMAAIGSVFSKDGEKIAKRVLKSFDGPPLTVEDVKESLTDAQKAVLFGRKPE
jgi:hypothetical protein